MVQSYHIWKHQGIYKEGTLYVFVSICIIPLQKQYYCIKIIQFEGWTHTFSSTLL